MTVVRSKALWLRETDRPHCISTHPTRFRYWAIFKRTRRRSNAMAQAAWVGTRVLF